MAYKDVGCWNWLNLWCETFLSLWGLLFNYTPPPPHLCCMQACKSCFPSNIHENIVAKIYAKFDVLNFFEEHSGFFLLSTSTFTLDAFVKVVHFNLVEYRYHLWQEKVCFRLDDVNWLRRSGCLYLWLLWNTECL